MPWTDVLRKIIKSILTIPLSSSQAERGQVKSLKLSYIFNFSFSVMNYIKANKRRSSLSPNSLANLVRIRESGPKSVLKLNAVAISEIWLEKHRIPKKKPDDQEGI